MTDTTEIQFLVKLTKDLINFEEITKKEVRFLCDNYYRIQTERLRHNNQYRELQAESCPAIFHEWMGQNFKKLEDNIKNILLNWCRQDVLGKRLLTVCGIGPVIASGLLAHIDFKKALSAASIWRYAGLDPTCKWEKGKKRPFNASLKKICFYAGESFIKVQSRDSDYYGKIYKQRRAYEEAKNSRGDYAELAKEKASKVGKSTEAYKSYSEGKLPPAHLLARSRRYTVKLFLSHLHEIAFEMENGCKPPFPFMNFPNHGHKLECPF